MGLFATTTVPGQSSATIVTGLQNHGRKFGRTALPSGVKLSEGWLYLYDHWERIPVLQETGEEASSRWNAENAALKI